MATSLATLTAKPLDEAIAARLIPAILGQFRSVLQRLAAGDPALAGQWHRLDLLRDTWVRVDFGTHRVAGWGQGSTTTVPSACMTASSSAASSEDR